MDINITRREGQKKLSDIGVRAKDFVVSSISIETSTDAAEGRDGLIVGDVRFAERSIVVPFYFLSEDLLNFATVRDKIFHLFTSKEELYIQEIRNREIDGYKFVNTTEPAAKKNEDNQVVSGKRYSVRLVNVIEIPQDGLMGEGELVFSTFETPYAESVNVITRKYDKDHFRFINEGHIPIDMRTQDDTEITFTGASSGLEIQNLTTGDTWRYDLTTATEDVITLKGVRSLKNGQSVFADTNKKMINLAVGNNEFSISGASGEFELTISTRFYFL